MLILRTGLPGASKTLNTLVEICNDSNNQGRPIHYNNIKLLLLDFSVCESFAGWFYGVFFPSLGKAKRPKYQRILSRIHAQDEIASVTSFPHLRALYDAWLSSNGHVDLWLTWVNRCYPVNRLIQLNEYLQLCDKPTFDDLAQFNLDWRSFSDPLSWYALERGSVIVVDECQQWFPPRPVGSKRPAHVSEFETHRHKGFDIHLITQDAKLLDSDVRRLTGRHIHFYNPFASNRVARLEADKVFDPNDYHSRQASVQKLIVRNKKFYGVYWSADFHTHKLRLPKKLLLIPIAIAFVVIALTMLFNSLFGSDSMLADHNYQPSPDSPGQTKTVQVQPVSSNSTSFRVLTGHHFGLGHHPLANVCTNIEFVGKESAGRRQRFLIRCITHHEDDDPTDQFFDSRYLYQLGYQVAYLSGYLEVRFNNQIYLLNDF